MIRALIVDDEPLARDTVRLVLKADRDVTVVDACNGVDAPARVAALRPDLMLLDVQMPVMDGFAVLAAIAPETLPAVVFITAYDRYAVRAFDVHALDYVLKPFEDRRLLAAIARAKTRGPASAPVAALLREQRYLQRFAVRGPERTLLIDCDDVDCLEAADDYVELHVGATVHLMRERLQDVEERLDPERFFRIHRSAIVNLDCVRELHPLVRGDALVVLAGGASFRCSRTRRAEFEQRLTRSPRRRDRSPRRS
ncbi:MAG TPA: LytTR family DNA-binding domain-containing protein [Polyangia bacterium]|nr:LytTR family DNA-binding domain-containing protein [Polyangia bacterium]